MKKIRLSLDALDVVSFATSGERNEPRGTVHGRDNPWEPMSRDYTINPNDCMYFTLGQVSCYQGQCGTNEYATCAEAGPSVGPSCDYICQDPTYGC